MPKRAYYKSLGLPNNASQDSVRKAHRTLARDRFVFEGFLPHKKGRQTRLLAIAEEVRTTVLYESPHRLVKCLGQIEEFMGKDRQVCVARELTKLYEEFRRGSAS